MEKKDWCELKKRSAKALERGDLVICVPPEDMLVYLEIVELARSLSISLTNPMAKSSISKVKSMIIKKVDEIV